MKNKKYSVVIIDDENCCVGNITASLENYPEVELLGTANNAKEGLTLIISSQPDLLFLDVEMPDKSGLELMSELQNRITWNMHVVFHTAHNKYLLDALRTSAFDFLLKPFTGDEFGIIMNRFFNHTKIQVQPEYFQSALTSILTNQQTFMVATVTGFQILKAENIVVFEYQSNKKSWIAQLTNQKLIQLKRGTTAEDITKYSSSFIQISQNFIINIDFLSFIDDGKCVLFPPYNEITHKITRTYLHTLQERFEVI